MSDRSTRLSLCSGRRMSIKSLFVLLCATVSMSAVAPISTAAGGAQEACPIGVDDPDVVTITYEDLWRVCAKAYGSVDFFWLPALLFLATEDLGTNELTIGTVSPDRKLTGQSVGAEAEAVRVTGTHGAYQTGILFRGGIGYTTASGDQNIGSFDPGTGFGLGIPGSLGGPSGAFLAANPQNVVTNIHYTGDLSWSSVFANVERRYEAQDHAFGGYVGTRYSGLDLEERMSADIPGFLSSVAYDTEIKTNAYGLHVGTRGRHDILQPIGGTWQPQISARAELGVAYIDATLRDHTSWTGFIAGVVADSQIEVSDTSWAAYGSVGGAVSLTNINNKAQIFLDAQYEHRPWFGSAYRNGTDPTSFDRAGADVLSVSIGARVRF